MAPQPTITFDAFIRRVAALLLGLSRQRCHAKVTITIQDGVIRYVDVNRGFLPDDLPDM